MERQAQSKRIVISFLGMDMNGKVFVKKWIFPNKKIRKIFLKLFLRDKEENSKFVIDLLKVILIVGYFFGCQIFRFQFSGENV